MWACASKRLDVVVELLAGEDAGMIDNSPYRPMIGRDTTTSEVRFSSKTLPQSGWRRLFRFSIVPRGMRQKLENVQLRVGRNIRHFRRLRGWSLEKFAERVAMSGKHLGEVERGNIPCSRGWRTFLAWMSLNSSAVLQTTPPTRQSSS